MTEAEWMVCSNPTPMLEVFQKQASDRKRRLFGCGYCRCEWYRLNERDQEAVEAAERYADGLVGKDEWQAALRLAWVVDGDGAGCQHRTPSRTSEAKVTALRSCNSLAHFLPARCTKNRHLQVALLRDLFGNPFRPVTIDPSWLAWNDGTVRKIAQAIYDERRFEDMPILADALEEAGCTNADILSHCRSEGPHVRGCWTIDLILGKS